MPRPRSRQIAAGAIVARAGMKALNVDGVDVCPWALREGILPHDLQTTLNQSFDLPLRPLSGSAWQGSGRRRARLADGHIFGPDPIGGVSAPHSG